jgi:hypothetical protein
MIHTLSDMGDPLQSIRPFSLKLDFNINGKPERKFVCITVYRTTCYQYYLSIK